MITTAIIVSIVLSGLVGAAYLSRPALERFLYYFSGFFIGSDIQSRVALSTAVGPSTWQTVDGDLVTFLRIKGSRRLIGPEDFDRLAQRLSDRLAIMLKDGSGKQYGFSVGFLSDPPGTEAIIQETLRPAVATAARLGMSTKAKTWFSSRLSNLRQKCNDEVIILAVTTLKSGLEKKDRERFLAWQRDVFEKAKIGKAKEKDFSQSLAPVYPVLTNRHEAVVKNLIYQFAQPEAGLGILIDTLRTDDAMYYLRRFVDGKGVPQNWRPLVFGLKAPMGSTLERQTDSANTQPLSLARQLFTEPSYELFDDFEIVRREGVYYGSFKLDVCPNEDPAPAFSGFFDQIGRQFPVAVNMEISANGMDYRKMDQMFSSFFGGFGQHNRALRDAWNTLKEIGEQEYVAAFRLVASTWATDRDAVRDQLSTLKMALQSWGGSTVSNESGAPVSLLAATAPALSRENPAPFVPGPLSTFARLLPVFRPASPWDAGQIVLTTREGRPYPVAFGTSLQAFWGTLIFAPPGRGKSFLMNVLNVGMAFSPGQTELPYITIIDKGMSSANTIEVLRAMLPPERKHYAVSIRLRNTAEYAINIFDTQLGLDSPTERERDFQSNMVSALCPALGSESGRFVGLVIDQAYKELSRDSLNAKRWQRALDHDISEKIETLGMRFGEDGTGPRIWDVVDTLFDAGEVHLATLAQRFAVPTLDYLITAASSDAVRDVYGNKQVDGERIIDVFNRSIMTSVREYALLSTYTRFDLGDARIVSIDLEEVLSTTTSEEARRRAEIMILFARQLGAKNYFLKWDEMAKQVPSRYREFQSNRIQRMAETLKFLEYDEFHNAHGMVNVQRMVETDFREGRKYNVVPVLSSQLFQDFSKNLVETSNNYFILGVGSEEAADEVQQAFGLSAAERRAIVQECLGPGSSSQGAPVFCMFKTDRGLVSQVLFNSASAMEMWAFNSSAVDSAVRTAVTRRLDGDFWQALLLLAQEFPVGTARYEIDRMRQAMGNTDDLEKSGIADTVARNVIQKARQREQQKAA